MSFLSLDVNELRERWTKLYLNLFMLKSHKPKVTEHLESFKEPLALFNEKMMPFLDKLEEIMKVTINADD